MWNNKEISQLQPLLSPENRWSLNLTRALTTLTFITLCWVHSHIYLQNKWNIHLCLRTWQFLEMFFQSLLLYTRWLLFQILATEVDFNSFVVCTGGWVLKCILIFSLSVTTFLAFKFFVCIVDLTWVWCSTLSSRIYKAHTETTAKYTSTVVLWFE